MPECIDSAGWDMPEHYSAIQLADIDGGLALSSPSGERSACGVYRYDAKAGNLGLSSTIPELNDAGGWNRPEHCWSIQ
jgi:hypothetical protein